VRTQGWIGRGSGGQWGVLRRGGWGGGKMLEHLFRGWWAKGVSGGGREEGCREEGGLLGYTASDDLVI